jgi:ABC-type lipoprotein release transport system permease subunit
MPMTEIIVALLGLLGTLAGSFLGVVAASKLTQYRLQQLEDKVSKHNSIIERTYVLEGQMAEVRHDIKDLKAYHRPVSN